LTPAELMQTAVRRDADTKRAKSADRPDLTPLVAMLATGGRKETRVRRN